MPKERKKTENRHRFRAVALPSVLILCLRRRKSLKIGIDPGK